MNVIKFLSLPSLKNLRKEKEIMYRSSYRRRLRHHHLRQPASLSIIDA
jgi:hypothetical protein